MKQVSIIGKCWWEGSRTGVIRTIVEDERVSLSSLEGDFRRMIKTRVISSFLVDMIDSLVDN